MKLALASLTLLVSLFVQAGRAQSQLPEPPEANPGRPTVSTPATLTPVGYLQFETGFLAASHSPEFSSRFTWNQSLKLSVTPRLEFLTAGEPTAHFAAGGSAANKVGDIFAGAQVVLQPGKGARPTVAVSYLHRVYDGGAPELDFGSPLNTAMILVSGDIKGFHYDANGLLLDLTRPPVRRAQFGQTLSISHHLAGKCSLSGEIWHFTQPFLRSNAVGNLWAVSYSARKTLVLDAGFNRGLTSTSTRWEAFIGFTYLLPHRMW